MSPQINCNDWKTIDESHCPIGEENYVADIRHKNGRVRLYPLLNTNKEKLQQRRQILRMSVSKLKAIDNPELQLHRTVCLKNTVIHMQAEVRWARAKAKSRLSSDAGLENAKPCKRKCLNNTNLQTAMTSKVNNDHLMNESGETIPNEFFTSPVLVAKISDDVTHLPLDTKCTVLSTSTGNFKIQQRDSNHSEHNSMDIHVDKQQSDCNTTHHSCLSGDELEMNIISVAKSCASQVQECFDTDHYHHMPVFSEC